MEAGKLFHIDLNDQYPGRYEDLRFSSANPKSAFWLVKFLEDVVQRFAPSGAHAYRTEDYGRERLFARGCMKTYLIHKKSLPLERRRPDSIHSEGNFYASRGSGWGYSAKGSTALLSHISTKMRSCLNACLRKTGSADGRYFARGEMTRSDELRLEFELRSLN
jgi:xylose isomerase